MKSQPSYTLGRHDNELFAVVGTEKAKGGQECEEPCPQWDLKTDDKIPCSTQG